MVVVVVRSSITATKQQQQQKIGGKKIDGKERNTGDCFILVLLLRSKRHFTVVKYQKSLQETYTVGK